MPLIIYKAGPMSVEKKRELVSGLVETASNVTGIKKEAYQVYITEYDLENIGVGSETLAQIKAKS